MIVNEFGQTNGFRVFVSCLFAEKTKENMRNINVLSTVSIHCLFFLKFNSAQTDFYKLWFVS